MDESRFELILYDYDYLPAYITTIIASYPRLRLCCVTIPLYHYNSSTWRSIEDEFYMAVLAVSFVLSLWVSFVRESQGVIDYWRSHTLLALIQAFVLRVQVLQD